MLFKSVSLIQPYSFIALLSSLDSVEIAGRNFGEFWIFMCLETIWVVGRLTTMLSRAIIHTVADLSEDCTRKLFKLKL
jgi:hypothetical protein